MLSPPPLNKFLSSCNFCAQKIKKIRLLKVLTTVLTTVQVDHKVFDQLKKEESKLDRKLSVQLKSQHLFSNMKTTPSS